LDFSLLRIPALITCEGTLAVMSPWVQACLHQKLRARGSCCPSRFVITQTSWLPFSSRL